jgi:fatty-acyl-CoA synthase
MSESFKHSNYVDIVRKLIPKIGKMGTNIESEIVPHLKRVIVCGHKKHKGMLNFDDLYQIHGYNDTEEMHKREKECNFEAATNIQFTSGTTGYPKGATLSHHNILNNANMMGDIMGYNENSNICCAVPLYHCFGMVVGSL